jgi:hypothetical protein
MPEATIAGIEPLLDEHQAAAVLHLKVATLRDWRQRRCGLPYVKLGRAVRYRRSDLADFLAASTVKPAAASEEA